MKVRETEIGMFMAKGFDVSLSYTHTLSLSLSFSFIHTQTLSLFLSLFLAPLSTENESYIQLN